MYILDGIDFHFNAPFYPFFFYSLLLYASYKDYKTGEIPDRCFLSIILFTMIAQPIDYRIPLFTFLLFSFFSWMGWLGFGDTKLLVAWSMYRGILAIYGFCIACIIASIFTLFSKQKERTIRFAPYLTCGFLCIDVFLTHFLV